LACLAFLNSTPGIGPKRRVPIGSGLDLDSTSTQAFSLNRTCVPDIRDFSLAVRTITAVQTSFFLAFFNGRAFLIEITIRSPIMAVAFVGLPKTRIH